MTNTEFTAEMKLTELKQLNAEIDKELRDVSCEFFDFGAASAEFAAKKLRELADKMDKLNVGYKEYLEMN